jgi:hypothetical protein
MREGEDILLIFNREFFDSRGVTSVNKITDIPDNDSVLFIGDHKQTSNPNKYLPEYFNFISQKPYIYSIICGKTDSVVDSSTSIPKNVKFIYCNNVDFDHKVIKFLPMGRDFRARKSFHIHPKDSKRDILAYCNFSLNTHWTRKAINLFVQDKSFIKKENIGNRGGGAKRHWSMPNDDFFLRLHTSKFVVCPRGTAPDSFRFYDTLYSGAVPIVIKHPMYDQFDHSELPILFLNHQKDFQKITENFLVEQYNILSKKIKPYYKTLDFNYWIKKIKS